MKTNFSVLPPTKNLIDTLPKTYKPVAKFINLLEDDSKLSTSRWVQELATNWFPKAIFARSLADFSEVTFLEFTENTIVYFCPQLLGNGVLKKLFSKNLPSQLKKAVATPAAELLKDTSKAAENKKLMPIKAAISVSALAIPLAEYSLSYVKNLFTMKLFKQADFNNIANLNKNKKEDPQQQKKVKESAKKHIKLAGGIFAGCLGLSALLLTKGKNSKLLNSFSELILAPGSKLFKNNKNLAKRVNQYLGLDFARNANGKMVMSNGQLTACVVVGGFGYFGAAKDRGKQNFKEVLYRFPLVGLYVITGSTLLEEGFKPMLKKKEAFKDIFSAKSGDPKLKDLGALAKEVAAKNKTSLEAEYQRLFRQKALIVMAPFLFGLGVMGLFVAGMSRYFTQYRYNKDAQNAKQNVQ